MPITRPNDRGALLSEWAWKSVKDAWQGDLRARYDCFGKLEAGELGVTRTASVTTSQGATLKTGESTRKQSLGIDALPERIDLVLR